MKRFLSTRRGSRSIRVRVLTTVAIPCTVLLILGVGASGYLVAQAYAAKDWASHVQAAISPDIRFISEVEEERRLTLSMMGAGGADSTGLAAQRLRVDVAVADLRRSGSELLALNPTAVRGVATRFETILNQLPGIRHKVDVSGISPQESYAYYNRLVELIGLGLQAVAQAAPDSLTAAQESTSVDLLHALDAMSRANALAVGGVAGGGLTADDLREYRNQVGSYHAQLQQLLPRLAGQEQARYNTLATSPAWQRLTTMENAVIDRGPGRVGRLDTRALPQSLTAWQDDARQVTAGLTSLWSNHHHLAEESAVTSGDRALRDSLLAGAGILVVTILTLGIAVRLSNRLIKRLKRLRAETLQLADEHLPRIVAQLRDGEAVDTSTAIPPLDHGRDEIAEVAAAFNKAQRTAMAAAAEEAKTREGTNAVFRDIAHRSQIVVRRQLELLDEAEGKQEDPAHLELLFRLDHLATRARRNAENLVILGGGRPGRKWRNPVPLDEIARSAVSETENFARIGTVHLPDMALKGTVVADLIHLLAELVDNATSFSPPESRVEVRGNVVGKGVLIEVSDQGLGIAEERRDLLNAMLHDPPDFQVMALSGQLRLGLFVVAQLAAQHDITVTLTDSDYGGVRAIVLVPTAAIATEPPAEDGARPAGQGVGRELPRFRRSRTAARPRQEMSWFEVQWPTEDEEPLEDAPTGELAAQTTSAVPSATANQDDHAQHAGDTRAPLPRRRRQANLSPQLAADTVNAAATDHKTPARTPSRARGTMADLVRGTRQGRAGGPKHGL